MLTKIIVLLVLLIPTLAFAQRSSDAENCSKAEIYNNRGIAHESKGEHDLAIADYNEAIRLTRNMHLPLTTSELRTKVKVSTT